MEVSSKKEEMKKYAQDTDSRMAELSQLTTARAAMTSAERDYEEAKRSHDEFMDSFPTKTSDYRRQLKVCWL